MKKILVLALMLCLSGCLERIGQVDRNLKPYGARWVKEGMTRESRKMDWISCGGESDLKNHYERKSGLTNKEFFDGLDAYQNQLWVCMKNRGYTYRSPSRPGVEDECNAGDCLYP
mgnify:CR=1 FL=1